MSHFTAVLDANVLHSQPLTSLLLELAVARLYRPAWSEDIHAEWRRSVLRVRPGVDPAALDRRRAAMDAAFPDACASGYAPLIESLTLPDPGDRHVLASTGATQLILVGHSMGGLVSRAWFRQHGCAKVARFISLGSPHQGSLMARIAIGRNGTQMHPGNPWLLDLARSTVLSAASLSIYSVHDNQVIPQRESSALDGARLLPIGGVSHLGKAFSNQVTQLLLRVLED